MANLLKQIPWKTRIAKAYKNGKFTKADKVAARNWQCCSFGEKVGFPPIMNGPIPQMFSAERELGMAFLKAVEADMPDLAENIHLAMQKIPRGL